MKILETRRAKKEVILGKHLRNSNRKNIIILILVSVNLVHIKTVNLSKAHLIRNMTRIMMKEMITII